MHETLFKEYLLQEQHFYHHFLKQKHRLQLNLVLTTSDDPEPEIVELSTSQKVTWIT